MTEFQPHIEKCSKGWTGKFCTQKESDFTSITADFEDDKNFQGWNCDKITTCGSFGKICGGYNTKAKSHEIKKTFKVDAGKYSIAFDFIKIDSW